MVGHRQGLGVTFGLVVGAPRARGAHVAPVFLVLRVHERVAVDLRGGGEHEAGPPGSGQPEGVVGALGAGLEYLDGDAPEVGRARCGGEMEDLLELSGNVYMGAYVVLYVLEVRLVGQERGHVCKPAGNQVVHADDLVTLCEEPLAEMTPDESGPSCNQRPRPSGSVPRRRHGHLRTCPGRSACVRYAPNPTWPFPTTPASKCSMRPVSP